MRNSALSATEAERDIPKRSTSGMEKPARGGGGPQPPRGSEFLLSSPALMRREPVAGPEAHSVSPGGEVITVGEKIRESASYWKRIRSSRLVDSSDASDAAGRHTVPQHIIYIK